jgi:hypothetical protein
MFSWTTKRSTGAVILESEDNWSRYKIKLRLISRMIDSWHQLKVDSFNRKINQGYKLRCWKASVGPPESSTNCRLAMSNRQMLAQIICVHRQAPKPSSSYYIAMMESAGAQGVDRTTDIGLTL